MNKEPTPDPTQIPPAALTCSILLPFTATSVELHQETRPNGGSRELFVGTVEELETAFLIATTLRRAGIVMAKRD